MGRGRHDVSFMGRPVSIAAVARGQILASNFSPFRRLRMSAWSGIFGAGGALARAFTGYVPRPSQRRMAERVAEALERREQLLVEAGTGTGKTFAYLVPALVSGLRVLISTGTRTLQDQLYNRDIPLLAGA